MRRQEKVTPLNEHMFLKREGGTVWHVALYPELTLCGHQLKLDTRRIRREPIIVFLSPSSQETLCLDCRRRMANMEDCPVEFSEVAPLGELCDVKSHTCHTGEVTCQLPAGHEGNHRCEYGAWSEGEDLESAVSELEGPRTLSIVINDEELLNCVVYEYNTKLQLALNELLESIAIIQAELTRMRVSRVLERKIK